ncbi:MAG: SH3 domain-containing protein, partial [Clostridiales bacterium]|nr:SH3 domain-containing protein [Clostridiales bacterium]
KSESGKSEIILRIPNGSKVIILEKKKEWTLIKFDDKEGYVMTQYLEF